MDSSSRVGGVVVSSAAAQGGISVTAAALAVGGPSPVGTPAAVAVPLELVSSVPNNHNPHQTHRPPSGDGSASQLTPATVYVDPSDLASVVSSCAGTGGLQLTTITVAVPGPLSPSDPAFLAAAAAGSLNPPPTAVSLPTVPAPQEQCNTLKWKYEQQNSKDKSGSSLVRAINPSINPRITYIMASQF